VKTGQVIIKEQIQDIWTRTQESNKKVWASEIGPTGHTAITANNTVHRKMHGWPKNWMT
jgi:hypothetical protein